MNVAEARIRKDGIVNPGNVLKEDRETYRSTQKTPRSRLPDPPVRTVGCFAVFPLPAILISILALRQKLWYSMENTQEESL